MLQVLLPVRERGGERGREREKCAFVADEVY